MEAPEIAAIGPKNLTISAKSDSVKPRHVDRISRTSLNHCALETRPIEHVEGFLFQIARNLALDYQRRKAVRNRYEASDAAREDIENVAAAEPSIEDDLIQRQRWRAFEDALAELPVRARTVWSMAKLQGRTCAEIAEHLGVSRNTVYNDIKLVMGHCQDVLARLDGD